MQEREAITIISHILPMRFTCFSPCRFAHFLGQICCLYSSVGYLFCCDVASITLPPPRPAHKFLCFCKIFRMSGLYLNLSHTRYSPPVCNCVREYPFSIRFTNQTLFQFFLLNLRWHHYYCLLTAADLKTLLKCHQI